MSKPHSQTVRGTLDNPKTKAAIKAGDKPPQIGDPTSVKPETYDGAEGKGKRVKAEDLVPNASSDTEDGDLPHVKEERERGRSKL